MTTPNEAAEAVYARLVSNIGTVPYTFDSEDFEGVDEWVRLTISTNSRAQETLGPPGSRKYLSGASILVQCYTRTDQGRAGSDTLCRTVTDIFEGVSFSGVNCNNSIARESPPKGRYLVTVVEIACTYDETK